MEDLHHSCSVGAAMGVCSCSVGVAIGVGVPL